VKLSAAVKGAVADADAESRKKKTPKRVSGPPEPRI
jgi:hypothetical protein